MSMYNIVVYNLSKSNAIGSFFLAFYLNEDSCSNVSETVLSALFIPLFIRTIKRAFLGEKEKR
jgi:hypothetical protein